MAIRPWTQACIALGSNLGDRDRHIQSAIERLGDRGDIRVERLSSIHETDPVGPHPQDKYLNAAAMLATTLSPRELLTRLLEIERTIGRDRSSTVRWGPRVIDLDLLLYGSEHLDEPGLQVPHPRLAERAFVLDPLVEIAPDSVVPLANGKQATVRQLHQAFHENAAIVRTSLPPVRPT